MKVYIPISFLCIAALIMTSAAQEQEYAHIVRKGTKATLTASGPRPVDLAARKLVEEFGVAISAEWCFINVGAIPEDL